MPSPEKARHTIIEYPAKLLVKVWPPDTDNQEVEAGSDDSSLRIVARAQWLKIISPGGTETIQGDCQLELAFPATIAHTPLKCFACGRSNAEVHCYAYIDRFICEDCCEKIAEGGGQ